MGLFSNIKAVLAFKRFADTEIKEAKKMDQAKPGWKTSEFWLTLLGTNLPVLIGAMSGFIPPKYAAIILAAANAAYGLIRAITKNGAVPTGSDASANVTVKAS